VRVGIVHGNIIRFKPSGEKTITCEISDPDHKLPRLDGCDAIIAPSGMRVNDDPDMPYVIVVDKFGQGQAQHYTCRAKAVRMTFFGRLDNRPLQGEHPVGKVRSIDEARRAQWVKASDNAKETLREGTTDGPVAASVEV
jgi:hypothetical protein